MGPGDFLVIALVAAGVFFALRSIRKNLKAGQCPGGCAGCGRGCSCGRHAAARQPEVPAPGSSHHTA